MIPTKESAALRAVCASLRAAESFASAAVVARSEAPAAAALCMIILISERLGNYSLNSICEYQAAQAFHVISDGILKCITD